MAQRLARIGLLVDSLVLPRWAHRVVFQLAAGEPAAFVVCVRNAAPRRPSKRPSAFRAFEALDRRFFRTAGDYLEPVDATPLLENVPLLTCTPVRRGLHDRLEEADLDALRGLDLDVLLQLGFSVLEGDVLGVARFGVWRFAHDDEERRGVPPLAWEVVRGDDVTETRLEAHTPAGVHVLERSYAATERNSFYRNRNAAYWKSSEFVGRALRDVARAGVLPPAPAREPQPAAAGAPGTLAMTRFLGARASRIARNRLQLRRSTCEWFLALRSAGAPELCSGELDGFVELPNPPGRYRADPFLVSHEGARWLFFEEAEIASDHGHLRVMAVAADGTCSQSRPVLQLDTHLSYPCVFEWRGVHFMIPETAEARSIALYRAVEFPWRWALEKVLFHDVYAVDATVLKHEGRLWLFVAMSVAGGSPNDELFLFHAGSPQGDWIPHPMNPIVSDVRRARPAGAIFREGGAWIRPAQDCAAAYGAAMVLHRIDVLNEQEYRETPVARIEPEWAPGLVCTHTVATDGEIAVIDGRQWRPRAR